jgi:hypothetical protein
MKTQMLAQFVEEALGNPDLSIQERKMITDVCDQLTCGREDLVEDPTIDALTILHQKGFPMPDNEARNEFKRMTKCASELKTGGNEEKANLLLHLWLNLRCGGTERTGD